MHPKEMIAVIEAFDRGEAIECRAKGNEFRKDGWMPATVPNWDFARSDYRISTKPKEKMVLYQWLVTESNGATWATSHQNEICKPPFNAIRLDKTRMEVEI